MSADPSGSVAFRASCEVARQVVGNPGALRWLMHIVEARLRDDHATPVATHVHLDIAEAIVEAHVEELTEPGLTAERRAQLESDPRCMLVVAALHYVTMPSCPAVPGRVDDLAILRWATDVVRYDMPVS